LASENDNFRLIFTEFAVAVEVLCML